MNFTKLIKYFDTGKDHDLYLQMWNESVTLKYGKK